MQTKIYRMWIRSSTHKKIPQSKTFSGTHDGMAAIKARAWLVAARASKWLGPDYDQWAVEGRPLTAGRYTPIAAGTVDA